MKRHALTLVALTSLLLSLDFGCGSDTTTDLVGDDGGADALAQLDGNGGGPDGTLPDGGGNNDANGADAHGDGGGGDGGDGGGSFGNDGGWNGNDSGACAPLGLQCANAAQCCSGNCNGGSCQPPACLSDGVACSGNAQCCSGTCNGTCTTLNAQCKTLGNACTSASDCCSQLCKGNVCQQSSFCAQVGDICVAQSDCCGGICTKAAGAAFGTCTQPPSGGAQCSMVDGTVCAGSPGTLPDGGIVYTDGGIPKCGGSCCSRSCAPWGPTGVLICQPATGCRPVGDLCHTDSDCCGGPGVPGPLPPSGKTSHCNIVAPNVVGVCANPQGCKPNGDICRLQLVQCNATDECCAGNVQQNDTCKQDLLGIPRCANASCHDAGGTCATSADCCNGVPCVPNPGFNGPDGGVPEFVCGATQCVPTSGLCTTNADCCPGNACNLPLGSTKGTCYSTTPPPPPPPPDGGAPDGAPADGAPADGAPADGGTCSLAGQICTQSSDCCNLLPCVSGRCLAN